MWKLLKPIAAKQGSVLCIEENEMTKYKMHWCVRRERTKWSDKKSSASSRQNGTQLINLTSTDASQVHFQFFTQTPGDPLQRSAVWVALYQQLF